MEKLQEGIQCMLEGRYEDVDPIVKELSHIEFNADS
jgi:hypothetical protein